MGEDGRRRSNISKQRRSAIAKAVLARRPSRKKPSDLEAAKTVLRRHGKVIADAKIINPRDKTGEIYVDARRHSVDEVIAMAGDIERREERRNAELRAQHGLEGD